MKTLIISLLTLLVGSAQAATSTTISADVTERFQSSQSLLTNGNFGSGINAWTATGLTAASVSTAANVARGDKSASVDASATAQYFTSTAKAIPAGLFATNGLARCKFKTDATDYLLQAYDGTNILSSVTIPASSTFITVDANFIFPSTGNISLRIASQSNAAIMYLDDCYLGAALNLTQVSQATLVGGAVVTGCAGGWTAASTSFTDMGTQTGCSYAVFGSAIAPATNLPAIKFSSLPPGEYRIEYEGILGTTVNGKIAYFQVSDGTNTAREVSQYYFGTTTGQINSLVNTIRYTTAQSNITFNIRGKNDTSGGVTIYGSTGNPGVIRVYRYPLASEIAVTANIPTSPTITHLTSSSGTYTTPAGTKYLRVRMVGAGGGGAGSGVGSTQGGNGGNTTFGGLTANGGTGAAAAVGSTGAGGAGGTATLGTIIGLAFSGATGQSANGEYATVTGNGGAKGGSGASTPLAGGGSTSGNFGAGIAGITNSGTGGGGGGIYLSGGMAGGGGGASGYIDAIIPNPSPTYSYAIGTAGSAGAAGTSGNAGAAGGSGYVVVEEIYGQMNPIILNQVSTDAAGGTRTFAAIFAGNAGNTAVCSSSSCTLSAQTGSAITSVTRSGTGSYTVNVGAGYCSGTLFCSINPSSIGTDVYATVSQSAVPTSTAMTFVTRANTNAAADGSGIIQCSCPK
jgi:hypothetical protein